MTLSSMTGFSRSEGDSAGVSWVWETKSVNGKGLDVRCKFPGGYERLENDVRARVQKRFKRGHVGVFLSVTTLAREVSHQINWSVLDQAIAAVPDILEKCPTATPPSVDGLLSLKGVIEPALDDMSDEEQQRIDESILTGFDRALDDLHINRREEGDRLLAILDERITVMRALQIQAAEYADTQNALVRERIQKGVGALMETLPPLSEDRLAQEAAILLTKSDVKEELDRLQAHCEAAAELLTKDDAVGRKFDFLCQEFNREANTLCSKAIAPELTQVGLELKVVIDQLREQVQNVE